MTESAPQLHVQALTDAFAQVGGLGPPTDEASRDSSRLVELASQAPVVRLVDVVLLEGVARRASDIHVEVFERDVMVRYRIDGRCYQVAQPPKSLALAIASRIKVLANLDVAESRLPQDGRILLTIDARQIDLRVSTLPTIYGESIVMRVLDRGSLDKTLVQLGMSAATQETIERLIRRPNGLLLVTGPTGAGKTTTLYACLTQLNNPELKLITTEDPVEYDLKGLVQVGINTKIALTFSTCLRSILRHDPDVIMVGEIRDQETAQLAVRAALTGHLVLSTLHTIDAASGITRLLDLGVEPFLLCSTLSGVLSQRLVRRLCERCRTATPIEEAQLKAMGLVPPIPLCQPMRIATATGCAACRRTGYQGRIGLFEFLSVDHQVRSLILKRTTGGQIRQSAIARGMPSLWAAGWAAVGTQQTTIDELLRALPPELR